MDTRSAETALRRARKALRHAVRMQGEAVSPKAAARHARRAQSAKRRLGDAVWTLERLTLESDPDAFA